LTKLKEKGRKLKLFDRQQQISDRRDERA